MDVFGKQLEQRRELEAQVYELAEALDKFVEYAGNLLDEKAAAGHKITVAHISLEIAAARALLRKVRGE